MIRRAVVLTDDAPADDDVARRHGDGARPARHRAPAVGPGAALRRELGGEPLSRLAGEFAGMVHFEVPPENANAFADSLRGLEASSGLKLVIAKSDSAQSRPGCTASSSSSSATIAWASSAT